MAQRIRVVRVLEYSYANVEAMEADMRCWEVQGVRDFSARLTIRSSALPLEVVEDPPELVEWSQTQTVCQACEGQERKLEPEPASSAGVSMHPYQPSHMGTFCGTVTNRDGSEYECGLPPSHEVHAPRRAVRDSPQA